MAISDFLIIDQLGFSQPISGHYSQVIPSESIHNLPVIREKGKSQNEDNKKNKARQIFGKTVISYPLICTYVCMNVHKECSRKIWCPLFSCYLRIEIRVFTVIPTNFCFFTSSLTKETMH